jgi:hypothetical protein
MVLPYLTGLMATKQKYDELPSMKACISTHLVGLKKSKLVIVKDIVCTLASS